MKNLLLLLFLVLSLPGTFAQIINGGFENWNGTEPEGWKTNNSSSFTSIVQSTECNSGSYSIMVSVTENNGITHYPFLKAGQDGNGFSVTEKYKYLVGYYKFLPANAKDAMYISVTILHRTDTDTTIVGVASSTFEKSEYFSHFDAGFYYSNETLAPNVIKITFSMLNSATGLPEAGSVFYLDDLSFSNTVDVKKHQVSELNFTLHQNYPNPFNPVTTIKYEIPATSFVKVSIYDLLGKTAATPVNTILKKGKYRTDWNAGNLPSGIYFCSIYSKPLDGTKEFSDVKKMILLK